MQDLKDRGLMKNTIVAVTTEFGRDPMHAENGSGGRGHWAKAFTCLVGGGPVRGGQVYGKTDKGYEATENQVSVPDLHATIGYAMGMPVDKVIHSDSGLHLTRPQRKANFCLILI